MNTPTQWVNLAVTAAAQNKKVLAVEGKYDEAVYREWFEMQLGPTWANYVHLEIARDRPRLLSGLKWLQDENHSAKDVIFGLVDRDEWEAADVTEIQGDKPTLLVNLS